MGIVELSDVDGGPAISSLSSDGGLKWVVLGSHLFMRYVIMLVDRLCVESDLGTGCELSDSPIGGGWLSISMVPGIIYCRLRSAIDDYNKEFRV